MPSKLASLAVALLIGNGALADASGDATRGETLYRQCAACHQIGEDATNRVGPHLNFVFGRTAGELDDFRYTRAFTMAGEEGLVWDHDTLDAFLADPRGYIPNTRMSFRGMSDQTDRNDLVAFLRVFSDNPQDIPESAATAVALDYEVAPEILAIIGDPTYGEYLSGECTSCHQASGAANGIPSITQWPTEDFVTVMHAYKEGARSHPVMEMMAQRLSNEEIAALAAYFEGAE